METFDVNNIVDTICNDLSAINLSLNPSLNTSTGANESSTVNLLNEEAIRKGKQNMAKIQEEEENGSFISNEDD